MQDQGKRMLLAVALVLGVLLVWNMFAPKDEPPPSTTTPAAAAPRAATPLVGPAVPDGAVAPRPEEQTLTLAFDNVAVTFSSYCGGLTSWKLAAAQYDHDVTRGELLPSKASLEKNHGMAADQLANLPACSAFDVNFVRGTSTFLVPHEAIWKGEQLSKTEVRYSYSSPELDVVKTFTVIPERYMLRLEVRVNVRPAQGGDARQQLAVTAFGYQDPAGTEASWGGSAPRSWASATRRDGELFATQVNSIIEWPRYEPAIQWTGYEHPYLLVGFAPRLVAGERVEKYTTAVDKQEGVPRGFMRTDMVFPSVTFRAGDPALVKEIVGYLGPKNYDELELADATAGFVTGFHSVIDLGWFAFIGRPLLWLMQKFHSVFGNWGVAIILLTILVKIATLYWTTKSMRSMKAMAALAPQLKALQSRYADDRQRQQAETMALYKQHNVNPVAGCLPILLQMPIWLALYRMLTNAGELYQQPFIPGWIDDLTATDPLHILPVVLVITMFLQARLQPATVDSRQQKFLQYGMPLMFGVMSFVFPAGSTLYIFTNTVLSALHSIYMNKFDKKSQAIAEQLKRSQEQAAAAVAAGAAKPSAKNGGPAKAKRVIDVKATEVAAATAVSDDGDDDEAPATAGTPAAGAARNRPRRKKRKR
jgi:YidC/Oxa1 family membrane protein insertase